MRISYLTLIIFFTCTFFLSANNLTNNNNLYTDSAKYENNIANIPKEENSNVGSTQNKWTLANCIEYARNNSIQVKGAILSSSSSQNDVQAAKAQRLPSLSFNTNQGLSNSHEVIDKSLSNDLEYTSSYSFKTDISIYNGSRITNNIKQKESVLLQDLALVEKSKNDIEIQVTKAFLEILYATENVKIDSISNNTALIQMQHAELKYKGGIINISNLAQLRAEYNSANYQLTFSKTIYDKTILNLKQLLELNINTDFNIIYPDLDDLEALRLIPNLEDVHKSALEYMPEVKAASMGINAAESDIKISKSMLIPNINLTAGVNTGYYTSPDFSFLNQLGNNLNENISVNIVIPIYQKGEAKSAIKRAQIQKSFADLEMENTKKILVETIENLYQDAIAAQSKYISALKQVEAATLSYTLIEKEYNAGLKSIVEMLSEKDVFLSAQKELIVAKYQSILSTKLLDFYQGEGIDF